MSAASTAEGFRVTVDVTFEEGEGYTAIVTRLDLPPDAVRVEEYGAGESVAVVAARGVAPALAAAAGAIYRAGRSGNP